MENTTSSEFSPSYYQRGNVQVWDFIGARGLDFMLSAAFQYIVRAGDKTPDATRDLNKAVAYIDKQILAVENGYRHQPALQMDAFDCHITLNEFVSLFGLSAQRAVALAQILAAAMEQNLPARLLHLRAARDAVVQEIMEVA
ncbi:MAG: DUF3310 domain-containing protein [Ignavibacteriae bacterium]|nr:DUF3310 domain-containing protein [Ignavibacteriota bacterium]